MKTPGQLSVSSNTVSGLNARESWRQRARRVRQERRMAAVLVPRYALPCVVTLTRLSAGVLDDDNLQGACKAIRDGIADIARVDDRDPRIVWHYRQTKCPRGAFGVRVTIETRTVTASHPKPKKTDHASSGDRYVIEGESVTLHEILARAGISQPTANQRLKRIRAGTLPNTWAALGKKAAKARTTPDIPRQPRKI